MYRTAGMLFAKCRGRKEGKLFIIKTINNANYKIRD